MLNIILLANFILGKILPRMYKIFQMNMLEVLYIWYTKNICIAQTN